MDLDTLENDTNDQIAANNEIYNIADCEDSSATTLTLRNTSANEEDTKALEYKNNEVDISKNIIEENSPSCSRIFVNHGQDEDIPKSVDEPCSSSQPTRTLEERLAAKDERLKRLEGQCKALVSQVTNTSNRSMAICSKLEDLHEIYGDNSRESENRRSTEQNETDDSNAEAKI